MVIVTEWQFVGADNFHETVPCSTLEAVANASYIENKSHSTGQRLVIFMTAGTSPTLFQTKGCTGCKKIGQTP